MIEISSGYVSRPLLAGEGLGVGAVRGLAEARLAARSPHPAGFAGHLLPQGEKGGARRGYQLETLSLRSIPPRGVAVAAPGPAPPVRAPVPRGAGRAARRGR